MLKIQAKKEKESDDDDSDNSESEDEAEAMKARYSLRITRKAKNFVKSNLHNFLSVPARKNCEIMVNVFAHFWPKWPKLKTQKYKVQQDNIFFFFSFNAKNFVKPNSLPYYLILFLTRAKNS